MASILDILNVQFFLCKFTTIAWIIDMMRLCSHCKFLENWLVEMFLKSAVSSTKIVLEYYLVCTLHVTGPVAVQYGGTSLLLPPMGLGRSDLNG